MQGVERVVRELLDAGALVGHLVAEGSMFAFLAAHREVMTNQSLWPTDPQAAEQMLNFFLLEKAFYEIEYELAHRPEWLRVPLTGMIRILSQHTDEVS